MHDNAVAAEDIHAAAVRKVANNPDIVLNRALWEPSTGTVDNIGLVQIDDFFSLEDGADFSMDDLNAFLLFDMAKGKETDLQCVRERDDSYAPANAWSVDQTRRITRSIRIGLTRIPRYLGGAHTNERPAVLFVLFVSSVS